MVGPVAGVDILEEMPPFTVTDLQVVEVRTMLVCSKKTLQVWALDMGR